MSALLLFGCHTLSTSAEGGSFFIADTTIFLAEGVQGHVARASGGCEDALPHHGEADGVLPKVRKASLPSAFQAFEHYEGILSQHLPALQLWNLKGGLLQGTVLQPVWCSQQLLFLLPTNTALPTLGCREVFILEDLKDANIVQFLGACFEEDNTMLVTEFMAGGTLYDAVGKDHAGKLGWYNR